ncbi:MAG: hypothetical protein IT214_06555 [Chitinophagaceae bacterium]|nr:hypothetical protein [Chitinophagaceae bacterium]
MQRTACIIAYFLFLLVNTGRANLFAQQYPFVHYTPKDGLVSNMIKNICQDSKGRLYFTSVNGLSVYDGSRFINYNSKNGLYFDMVNCVMEMGPDSIWVVTNSSKINCLVKGKMKILPFKEEHIINNLCRDEKGDIYAAAEDGLLFFDKKDHFTKLPFIDLRGNDASSYINYILNAGEYLIIQRDISLVSDNEKILYLYCKSSQNIIAEIPSIYAVVSAPDGRTWASTEAGIKAIDTTWLKKGKLILQELPEHFAHLKKKGRLSIVFDSGNNCWLGDQSSILFKVAPDGTTTSFTSASGLGMFYINSVFRDREGITWIATNNGGVSKLVHNNFTHIEKPFDLVQPSIISYNQESENFLVYSASAAAAAIIHDTKKEIFRFNDPGPLSELIETPYGFFGTKKNTIYKLAAKNTIFYSKALASDSSDNTYSRQLIDKNGNLITAGKYHLTAIIKGKTVFKKEIPYYTDFPAIDSKGNIWIATRASDLIMYSTHPDDPSNYLEQKLFFKPELTGISPRSIVLDKNDDFWIGTRNHGIHVFTIQKGKLIKKFSLTTAAGLSDDFITHLSCDQENNIWASSALGLDKISNKTGAPVIENITRQNNIFQSVFDVVLDKDNIAWGIVSNGLIKITPELKKKSDYIPTLMVSMLKTEKDTIYEEQPLSYTQNNLSFSFAATSFFNEKQILYSYRLHGGSNNQWSEPSNLSTVSFIDLHPGDYALEIKAVFPAGRYPPQFLSYKFSITAPWWQTWWFHSLAALFIITALFFVSRYYYRRKLEIKMAALEKQQAIEKERTRIATDMHDDLGAGLSRIKFLSQALETKNPDNAAIKTGLEKITNFSDEMAEKMGEIIWALNQKNDTLADLVAYIRSYALEYLSNHDIACTMDTPLHLPETFIAGEMRRNIFLAVKECLHNIIKHAQATSVNFSVRLNELIEIVIHDNGKGIDWNHLRAAGMGLQNITKRMNEVNGKASFLNENGAKVILRIPLSL